MARKLRAHVHVAGTVYGPGDQVPAKVAKLIGDHAWEDAGTAPAAEQEQREPETVEEPPRSGRGSGVEAWRAFAESKDVGLDDGMDRDAVIAACEQAGVIEPEQPKE